MKPNIIKTLLSVLLLGLVGCGTPPAPQPYVPKLVETTSGKPEIVLPTKDLDAAKSVIIAYNMGKDNGQNYRVIEDSAYSLIIGGRFVRHEYTFLKEADGIRVLYVQIFGGFMTHTLDNQQFNNCIEHLRAIRAKF